MQTREEIISTMDVDQRVRKLETLVTLLVEYINRYNITANYCWVYGVIHFTSPAG